MAAQSVATGIALKRVFKKHGIKHAISFHRSIRAADRFREQQDAFNPLRDIGPRTANFHISSKKTAGERGDLLREFVSRKLSLMTNARCLTEGVDVPATDCVVFADPKQSRIDIVQAAGRALRRYPGKAYGYILLPLMVPPRMRFEDFAKTTAFRQVASTITALSTQDERIAEEFRAIQRGRLPSGKIVEIEGDVLLGMKMEVDDFAEAISTRIWNSVGRANYRSFEDARAFVRSLDLKSEAEWRNYVQSGEKPADIPSNAHSVYVDTGWAGMGDWLGTDTIATRLREYRSFKNARACVRRLGLQSQREWFDYCKSGKKPDDIPANPSQTYVQAGWIGMGDWLGIGRVADQFRKYQSFKKARTFVRRLALKSHAEWGEYCKSGKKPDNIPAGPSRTYAKAGWAGMGDWLGTGRIADQFREYRPFKKARAFVRRLGLKSHAEWINYCRSGEKPADISAKPDRTYEEDGWVGWGDWLGTGTVAAHLRQYKSFNKARAFVRRLGLQSQREWFDYCKSHKKPDDIPTAPYNTYAKTGWAGMGDWLGTGRSADQFREYRPFKKARAFVRRLGLQSQREWFDYCKSGKKPDDIPAGPRNTYAKAGWAGMGDWLGTGTVAAHLRQYKSFNKARTYVRALGLKSQREWGEYCKSGKKPADIPATPDQTYADMGWTGLGDWLGTGTVAPNLRQYKSFNKARAFVHRLGLKSEAEWREYCKSGKKPNDIPRHVHSVYADTGWAGMGDWLGTGAVANFLRKYRPFKKASAFVRRLGLKSINEWYQYCRSGKKPDDIPASPYQTYARAGWAGYPDWLGYSPKR